MDFKDKEKFFQIKEGCVYCLRIHFVVRFDIVYGLRFVNNVYKILAKVEKEEEKKLGPSPTTYFLMGRSELKDMIHSKFPRERRILPAAKAQMKPDYTPKI